jgi:acyl dehydratase
MTTRELSGSPNMLSLYARAGIGGLPLASRLPLIGSRGDDVPDLELLLRELEIDREHVAAYCRVCGFRLRDELPPTYPHVLAFPLHMALMTDSSFPFPAMGLVHIENRIKQRRPIRLTERLSLRVAATKLEPHPKGRQFALVTEAGVGDELVWEARSTNLRRGGGEGGDGRKGDDDEPPELPSAAEWRLPGDLGRRYAGVSGDRNPIHLHDLPAKAFGFPRAIAHGMWTKARCLAALEGRLPDAFGVDVRFRKPILLPARVTFGERQEGDRIRFGVRDADGGAPHLDGLLEPV